MNQDMLAFVTVCVRRTSNSDLYFDIFMVCLIVGGGGGGGAGGAGLTLLIQIIPPPPPIVHAVYYLTYENSVTIHYGAPNELLTPQDSRCTN